MPAKRDEYYQAGRFCLRREQRRKSVKRWRIAQYPNYRWWRSVSFTTAQSDAYGGRYPKQHSL